MHIAASGDRPRADHASGGLRHTPPALATCIRFCPHHQEFLLVEVKELRGQQAVADPTSFRNQRGDVSPHWPEADLYFSGRGKPGTLLPVSSVRWADGCWSPRDLIPEFHGYIDRLVIHFVFVWLTTLRSGLPFRLSSLLAIYLARYCQTLHADDRRVGVFPRRFIGFL